MGEDAVWDAGTKSKCSLRKQGRRASWAAVDVPTDAARTSAGMKACVSGRGDGVTGSNFNDGKKDGWTDMQEADMADKMIRTKENRTIAGRVPVSFTRWRMTLSTR